MHNIFNFNNVRTIKIGKVELRHCPECNKWYDRATMVVVNYNTRNEIEVCVDCYEEKFFIPPEPLKKGEDQCLK